MAVSEYCAGVEGEVSRVAGNRGSKQEGLTDHLVARSQDVRLAVGQVEAKHARSEGRVHEGADEDLEVGQAELVEVADGGALVVEERGRGQGGRVGPELAGQEEDATRRPGLSQEIASQLEAAEESLWP